LQFDSSVLLNAILDTAGVGICVTDEEGCFVLVNRAYSTLYGYAGEQLLGQPFTMLVPAASQATMMLYYRQFFASSSSQVRSLAAAVERADGAALHVVVNASLLTLGDGRRFQVMSVTDVTLQKAQADELTRRAEQAEKEAATKSNLLVELDQKLGIIERQHHQIVELSAPILDVWDRIIALPLIGRFDRARAAAVTELLLGAVVARRVQYVLLDLTSCEFVDSSHSQLIAQMVQAVQLLGARCIMTGIRPQVAQSLVALNADMSQLHTLRSLQEALRTCIPLVEKSAGGR
jgi:rsbT co-antagonist protein RsbR